MWAMKSYPGLISKAPRQQFFNFFYIADKNQDSTIVQSNRNVTKATYVLWTECLHLSNIHNLKP